MAAFRGMRDVVTTRISEKTLTQTGARGDHSNGSSLNGFALIQGEDIFSLEDGDRISHRFKIVEQGDSREVEGGLNRPSIHHPGKVGDLSPAFDHWTRHPKAGS